MKTQFVTESISPILLSVPMSFAFKASHGWCPDPARLLGPASAVLARSLHSHIENPTIDDLNYHQQLQLFPVDEHWHLRSYLCYLMNNWNNEIINNLVVLHWPAKLIISHRWLTIWRFQYSKLMLVQSWFLVLNPRQIIWMMCMMTMCMLIDSNKTPINSSFPSQLIPYDTSIHINLFHCKILFLLFIFRDFDQLIVEYDWFF